MACHKSDFRPNMDDLPKDFSPKFSAKSITTIPSRSDIPQPVPVTPIAPQAKLSSEKYAFLSKEIKRKGKKIPAIAALLHSEMPW